MRKFIIFVPVLFLVGCSMAIDTVKRSRTQNILVRTPHVDDAKCKLTDARGRSWRVRKTPDVVAVEDGHSPLQVICRKDGYKTTIKTVNEHKEELLTIDGKRISIESGHHFTTKAPRLIPTAIKEASSFMLDPTGNISTKYPNEIAIWMEPEVWQSEQAMRVWAYDRYIWENKIILAEEDAEIKDEKRKEARRSKKHARKERKEEYWDKAKKALDPKVVADAMRAGTKWTVEGADEIVGGAVDSGGMVVVKSTDIVGENIEKVIPRKGIESAAEKMKNYKMGGDGKWRHSGDSKLEKSGWFANWLKHSVVGKVGNWGKRDKAAKVAEGDETAESKLEQRIKDIEAINNIGDAPPWAGEK